MEGLHKRPSFADTTDSPPASAGVSLGVLGSRGLESGLSNPMGPGAPGYGVGGKSVRMAVLRRSISVGGTLGLKMR